MENKHTPKRTACLRHLPWLGAVLVAAVCIVAYIPAMNGGFVWDDEAWTSSISSLLADLQVLNPFTALPQTTIRKLQGSPNLLGNVEPGKA
jgi:hypothetical protein